MAHIQENEETKMSKNIVREANENAAKNPQPVESENPGTPAEKESYKLVEIVAACFLLLGVVNFFSGFVLANEAGRDEWMYIIGGILAAMICFGWAALTKVCSLYIKEHDK